MQLSKKLKATGLGIGAVSGAAIAIWPTYWWLGVPGLIVASGVLVEPWWVELFGYASVTKIYLERKRMLLLSAGLGFVLLGVGLVAWWARAGAAPEQTGIAQGGPEQTVVPQVSDAELEKLRSDLRRAQGEANNWRNDNASLQRQIEGLKGIANDTEDQALARQAMYRFYDRSFAPAVSSLREFATLLDNPLGPLPPPKDGQFRREWMVSGLLAYAVVRWDFEPHWERLSGDQDANNRAVKPVPFAELETRMQSAFCAYERLAFWTQYAALAWSGFNRNSFEPYQRWNSRDAALVAAIADLAATPGLDRFQARWESCRGPEQWQTQRFRIRDLGETTNR